jgi:hypothetical protein
MNKYILILMTFLSILSFASALIVEAPAVIDVYETEEFYIDITNNTNTAKDLSLNFYTTTDVKTFAPNVVPANTTVKAKIIVDNDYEKYTELESKLEINLGNNYSERKILLRFFGEERAEEQVIEGANAFFSFAAVNSLFTLSNYSILEISAMSFLVLLIIVLAVALVVRIVKRV